jgi:hypothetical protein
MQRVWFLSALLSVLLLIACTQKDSSQASPDANAPHANVVMKDGTRLAGAVRSSTPTELTLNMDDGGTRTVLTKDIKSINYSDAATTNSAAATTNQPSNAPAPEPRDTPQAARPHPNRTAIQTTTFVIPSGTQISVRNDETIDSGKVTEGQTYAAEVTSDVRDANGAVVIPQGANAQLVIKSASSGGRIRGASDLVIDLQSISVDGQQYAVTASDFQEQGKSGIGGNKRTAEYVGGGTALGAIVGAIAGQGKGAAIGAASGAGAGALTQVLTKGGSIKVPAETLMTFMLEKPIRIVERR